MDKLSIMKEKGEFVFNTMKEILYSLRMFFILLDLQLTYSIWIHLMNKIAGYLIKTKTLQ